MNKAAAARLAALEAQAARHRYRPVDNLPADPSARAALYRRLLAAAPVDPNVRAQLLSLPPAERIQRYRARLRGR
jgi:hypothetical protein